MEDGFILLLYVVRYLKYDYRMKLSSNPRRTNAKQITKWMMWIFILLLSTIMRLPGADWDGGYALHPDERYLVDLAQKVPLYGNPCSVDPNYPYGHLPLYLLNAIFPASNFSDPLFAARIFSGLLGVVLVSITGGVGRTLGGEKIGWIAALLIAFAPLLIQHARFYTVDTMATVAVTFALLAACRKNWGLAGLAGAIALSSKISLIWIWLVLTICLYLDNHNLIKNRKAQQKFMRDSLKLYGWGILTFVLTSPWMFITPQLCWSGPLAQAGLVSGQFVVPYTLQFTGTLPVLYPLRQMAVWGLGLPATLFGVLAWGVELSRGGRIQRCRRILILWIMFYGLGMGVLYVKFPRYYLPLYVPLAILGAAWANELKISRRHKIVRVFLTFFYLSPTILAGMAQVSVYRMTHPWITASQWIEQNMQSGDSIAYENWDYPLPLLDKPNPYRMLPMPVYDSETIDKTIVLDHILEEADIIVLASRRGYGAIFRNMQRFESTFDWYQTVFANRQVILFTNCPYLGPVAFSDDALVDNGLPVIQPLHERCRLPFSIRLPRLDESYRVYDAPLVAILMKADR